MLSTRKCSLTTLVAAALCTALALPAMAQHSTPDSAVQAQNQQDKQQKARTERHAKRLSEFKKALQISPAQEAAWTAFENQMQTQTGYQRQDRAAMAVMNTPERLDLMRKHRTERMAKAEERDQAIKALYAALSPEQQKTMDTHWQQAMHKHRSKHHMHKMGDGQRQAH
jgi:periplasmic protein CpxP/Spy